MINALLKENHLDAILISSSANVTYLSGFGNFVEGERETFLLMTDTKNFILSNPLYLEEIAKKIKNFTPIEISRAMTSVQQALQIMNKKGQIKKVGFEPNNLSVAEYQLFKKVLPEMIPVDTSRLRTIKTVAEIKRIEEACQLGDKTFLYVLKQLQKGVTEKEIAFAIESFIKQAGGDISFRPIVAFGAHSSMPHYIPQDTKLKDNMIVLMDFGAKIEHYCSDMTRTVFFGKATLEQKRMYETVLHAQQDAINALYDTKDAKAIDASAREAIIANGYESIPHSLGHGIGIEVHEAPRLSSASKDTLTDGMVFSIEPGIYIPDGGGVRIEDLVVLEKGKPRLLTHAPKEFLEL